jgi:hypothetical protein
LQNIFTAFSFEIQGCHCTTFNFHIHLYKTMANTSATDFNANVNELTSILQNIHSDGLVKPLPEAVDYYTIGNSDLPEETPLSQDDATLPHATLQDILQEGIIHEKFFG